MTCIPGLVSTIIPVYNRPVLLAEAVASVVAQTYTNVEIIIADDGSTDDTPAVADALASRHPSVRVLHLAHLGHIGLVREAGRMAARGEFLQYLDSDDLIAPRKFERMVTALSEHPDCDIAYCYTRRYVRGHSPHDAPTERTGLTFTSMLPAYFGARTWHTSTPLYRRSLCDKAGPWSDLLFWEDIEYDIRLATFGPRLYHCREYLTDFRDHEFARACGELAFVDRQQLGHAANAASLIFGHVSTAGLTADHAEVRLFLDDVRVIRQRCRDAGDLEAAVQTCTTLLAQAYGRDPDGERPLRLQVALEPQASALTAAPGQIAHLPVTVTNQSSIALRDGEFAAELSSHLRAADGTPVTFDHPTTVFRNPLLPGQRRLERIAVSAPETPGDYVVELDLLWGNTVWLRSTGVALPEVALRVARSLRDDHWWVETDGGNAAMLTEPVRGEDRVRLEIQRAVTETPWHLQLNLSGFAVDAGANYVVTFEARADRPRRTSVAVSRAHGNWGGLGLYSEVELGTTWQPYRLAFAARESDDNVRVHFDAGGSDISLEVKGCALHLQQARVSSPNPQVAQQP